MPGSTQENGGVPDLIPVRMLNEFVYCPRLSYLEWVEQEWKDNYETTDGSYEHRRVDDERGTLPEPDRITEPFEVSSVHVAAPKIGLKGVIDVVEGENGVVKPVDYKRGSSPNIPENAYEPERVQVCAQALILRESSIKNLPIDASSTEVKRKKREAKTDKIDAMKRVRHLVRFIG